MKVKEVIKMIEDDGWYLARTRGSHRQYKHASKVGLVTVPGKLSDDLAPGTLNSVEASGAKEMKKYLVVVEKTSTGFSAYSPDLDGCVATGSTRQEVEKNMQEAIRFHLDGMAEEGLAIPEPNSYSSYVEVPA